METVLAEAIVKISREIDDAFDSRLEIPSDARQQLYVAMRHAAMSGGKRLRPLLVAASSHLFNVASAAVVQVALAIEAIHVYSLIHDDMPCMDDDDMRRGKPTVHKLFDEATAVLAGDSLHALAFEWLADPITHHDPLVRCALVAALARASGPAGMAGGQMMDLVAGSLIFDLPTVVHLQELKTGALIMFAVEAGAILGQASDEEQAALVDYARRIGLAFQIADDLLDVEGDATLAGKALQKDADAGKATFVSLLGVDKARARARDLVDEAIARVAIFGERADLLRAIARYTLERDR
jgi:farnesyl diphosphate synthase